MSEEKDIRHDRAAQRETLRWIGQVCGKNLYGIGWLALASGVLSAVSVLSALIFKRIVDSATGGDRHTFLLYIGLYAGMFLFNTLVRVARYYYGETVSFSLEKGMKSRLYADLMDADFSSLSQKHTGELMNYFTGDVNIVIDDLLSLGPGLLSLAVRLIGAMAVLAAWDPRFCLLYIVAGVASAAATTKLRPIMKRLQKNVRDEYDALCNYLQETLENIVMVRAFEAQPRARRRLERLMDTLRGARRKRSNFSNFCNTGFSALMDCGYLFALLWCGVRLLDGTLSYGTLTAVLYLVGMIQEPFASVSSYIPQYYAMCTSAERLKKLMELPKESEHSAPVPEKLTENFRALCVENVDFSYDRSPVLQNAQLRIERGEFIALTGRSGIGKSTLFKLLLALYRPGSGSVTVETADGCLPVGAGTRGLFAYVPQGNFLISGSIYDCVRFLPEGSAPTEEEKARVRWACRVACAEDFILAMPRQYETQVGERGTGLSEGQAQRLAVARALYAGAPVLLLDESTSALDEALERDLLENIRALTDKTVLIVTHRRKALAVCDRVIRLENGRFAEGEAEHGECKTGS